MGPTLEPDTGYGPDEATQKGISILRPVSPHTETLVPEVCPWPMALRTEKVQRWEKESQPEALLPPLFFIYLSTLWGQKWGPVGLE